MANNGFGPGTEGDGNFIVNLGRVPGIQQGLAAARPASGAAIDVWYLATDTQILYRWDGAVWQAELNFGGGGGGNWQAVMTAGNTSTINAIWLDPISGVQTAAMGVFPVVGPTAGASFVQRVGSNVPLVGCGIGIDASTSPDVGAPYFFAWNPADGWGGQIQIGFETMSLLGRRQKFPDAPGRVQVSGDGLVLPIKLVSANYACTRYDYTILVDTSAGVHTITLPTTTGQIVNIKVAVTGNNITVVPPVGTIDGNASATILGAVTKNFLTVQFDGTNYWII